MKFSPRSGRFRSKLAFAAVAAFFVVAAGVHAVAIARPSVADDSPAWRHALFVAINLTVAVLLVVAPRSRAFVAAFALLSAQQLYSHGGAAIRAFRDRGEIDWASVVVVIAMPLVLAALLRERQRAR